MKRLEDMGIRYANNFIDYDRSKWPSYSLLVDSFEYDILEWNEFGSYQGDTLVLLRADYAYGLCHIGWGSCSGCDALEGCTTLEELTELRDEIHDDIIWHNKRDMIEVLKLKRQAQTDYLWSTDKVAVGLAFDSMIQIMEGGNDAVHRN